MSSIVSVNLPVRYFEALKPPYKGVGATILGVRLVRGTKTHQLTGLGKHAWPFLGCHQTHTHLLVRVEKVLSRRLHCVVRCPTVCFKLRAFAVTRCVAPSLRRRQGSPEVTRSSVKTLRTTLATNIRTTRTVSLSSSSLSVGTQMYMRQLHQEIQTRVRTVQMTWARAFIFYGSDLGKRELEEGGYSNRFVSVGLPPLILSTFVQIVNMPIIRAT